MNESDSSESSQWGWWVAVVFGVQAVLLWWVSSGKSDEVTVMKHRWCKWTLRSWRRWPWKSPCLWGNRAQMVFPPSG